jgi:glutathione S-transferase
MNKITLYSGNKISSWSLRAWLMLVQTGTDFEAIFIQLDKPDAKEKIATFSPSKKVPVLKHGDLVVWDSLSIGEYLAETFPRAHLWPVDSQARAFARSISNEMHSGFQALREYLPFNPEERLTGHLIPYEAQLDIQRIIDIWEECFKRFSTGENFLFDHFTIADAMFAPVAMRFITYDVQLPPIATYYVKKIMALPEIKMWCNDL